jgi:hypothetical protein
MDRACRWLSGVATGKLTRQIKTSKCASVQSEIAEHMGAGAEITVLNLTTAVSNSRAEVPRPCVSAGYALEVCP